jgi:hypothetical protein
VRWWLCWAWLDLFGCDGFEPPRFFSTTIFQCRNLDVGGCWRQWQQRASLRRVKTLADLNVNCHQRRIIRRSSITPIKILRCANHLHQLLPLISQLPMWLKFVISRAPLQDRAVKRESIAAIGQGSGATLTF